MKFTYTPAAGEPEDTFAFGRTWHAGEGVEIPESHDHFETLKAHPHFGGAKDRDKPGAADKADAEMVKRLDGRSKEARDARVKANAAMEDADAKERAAETLRGIAAAKNSDDRDPPVTNH